MKKSLSLLLAVAMVFSMFASVALAADEELTAQQKFEALQAEGIFAGMGDGSAGLDQEMTRAQFARVAGLLAGLDVDAQPSTTSFTDVPSTHWAYQEVEAAVAAGFMSGDGNGTFRPSDNVSVQEMARVLVDVLGLEVDEEATVEGEVADWAVGYVAAAVEAGIIAASDDYTVAALRSQLVESSYATYSVLNPDGYVMDAEITGAGIITLTFNQEVEDTDNVTVTVQKENSSASSIELDWDNDNTVLEITRANGSDFLEGVYTITVEGIDTLEENTAQVEFTEEQAARIELGDAVYYTSEEEDDEYEAEVEFRIYNQYNEDITEEVSASDLDADIGSGAEIEVDKDGSHANGILVITELDEYLDEVFVSVSHEEDHINANAILPIREERVVSEFTILGFDIEDDEQLEGGEEYVLLYEAYDQFGNEYTVDHDNKDDDGELVDLDRVRFDVIGDDDVLDEDEDIDINSDDEIVVEFGEDFDNVEEITLRSYVSRTGHISEYTFEVYGDAAPASVDLVVPDEVFSGDDYEIELQVFDSEGELLDTDDIEDAIISGELDVDIDGNDAVYDGELNATNGYRLRERDDKTYIVVYAKYTTLDRDEEDFEIEVEVDDTNDKASVEVTVAEKSYPVSIEITTDVTKAVYSADIDLEAEILDQYDEPMDEGVEGYDVEINVSGDESFEYTASTSDMIKDLANGDVTFTALNHPGEIEVEVVLTEDGEEVDSDSIDLEVVDLDDENLDFEVDELDTVAGFEDESGVLERYYSQTIELIAEDSHGDEVAVPTSWVSYVSSNDPGLVQTGYNSADDEWYIYGVSDEDGETQINVSVLTPVGDTDYLTVDVTAASDLPVALSLTAYDGNDNEVSSIDDVDASDLSGVNMFEENDFFYFEAEDQYGETDYLPIYANAVIIVRDLDNDTAVTLSYDEEEDDNFMYDFQSGGEYEVTAQVSGKSETVNIYPQ